MDLPQANQPETATRLGRVVVAVLAALDGLLVLQWLTYTIRVAPTFREMIADFGATVRLPTAVAYHPAYGGTVTAGLAIAVIVALTVPRSLARKAAALGGILVTGVAAYLATAYALYIPMFEMADALR